jgi:hypothetical protein
MKPVVFERVYGHADIIASLASTLDVLWASYASVTKYSCYDSLEV